MKHAVYDLLISYYFRIDFSAAMSVPDEMVLPCRQCPRTFKLQEFYDKHQKVHQLKKQHVCTLCGFVYGAAKGLEGHMDSAHRNDAQPTNPVQPIKPMQELPFGLGFHFLQRPGVMATLDQARLAQESASLLQKAHQAMLAQMNNARTNMAAGLTMVPLSISAGSSISPNVSPASRAKEDKTKIPSPAGTGNYRIYGKGRDTKLILQLFYIVVL